MVNLDDDASCTAVSGDHVLIQHPNPGGFSATPVIQNDPMLMGDAGLVFQQPGTAGEFNALTLMDPDNVAQVMRSMRPQKK